VSNFDKSCNMKRDPNKTARNQQVLELKRRRRELLPAVLEELKDVNEGRYDDEASLNAFIGSKADEYIDLKNDVIKSPLEFRSKWIKGLTREVADSRSRRFPSRHQRIFDLLNGDFHNFKLYVRAFLDGSFLKHYEELYKTRPKLDESEYWFGPTGDEFGLLVTPRFDGGRWENDRSEIRHFRQPYWTVAHVVETGLCYMHENRVRPFSCVEDYLHFFRDLVRRTKSKYQLDIADRYIELVQGSPVPETVPLLIPELRYDALKVKHEHRLDFLVINPWSMEKFGFEISPYSSHFKVAGVGKSLAKFNAENKDNIEKEMRKHKKYWRSYGVAYVTYTDADLVDMGEVWRDVERHLKLEKVDEQIELALLEELL
jgi:hypothetical protein